MPRSLIASLTVALALLASPGALADADPASDVLLTDEVFLPYDAKISSDLSDTLKSEVAKANAHGYKLKVAVIETKLDLGGITSFFGKPKQYAHFLGLELSIAYKGRLLVVMPKGFGIYYGKRSTTKTDATLRKIHVSASGDGLVKSATAAVKKLVAVKALK